MTIYLDASVLVPLLVKEASSSAVEALVNKHGGALVVSEFAAAEVASALSRLARTGLMLADRATMLLAAFDAWRSNEADPADLEASDVHLASDYVRQFDLMLRVRTPCTSLFAVASDSRLFPSIGAWSRQLEGWPSKLKCHAPKLENMRHRAAERPLNRSRAAPTPSSSRGSRRPAELPLPGAPAPGRWRVLLRGAGSRG